MKGGMEWKEEWNGRRNGIEWKEWNGMEGRVE